MPLNLFYTMVQKSQKWPKTQIKGGGPALKHLCCLEMRCVCILRARARARVCVCVCVCACVNVLWWVELCYFYWYTLFVCVCVYVQLFWSIENCLYLGGGVGGGQDCLKKEPAVEQVYLMPQSRCTLLVDLFSHGWAPWVNGIGMREADMRTFSQKDTSFSFSGMITLFTALLAICLSGTGQTW